MNYLGQQQTQLTALSDTQRIFSLQTPYMQGTDVAKLQTQLIKAGYSLPQYGIDGQYGPETKMAVTAFQEDNGLSITGSVGPKTSTALQTAAASSSSSGTPPAGTGNYSQSSMLPTQAFNGFGSGIAQWWKPLPTTLKVMYGTGTAIFVGGIAVAIANKK